MITVLIAEFKGFTKELLRRANAQAKLARRLTDSCNSKMAMPSVKKEDKALQDIC